ncbi:MAG: pentapeptide repeat-containing protein [Marinicaulis sp.]|nr:pentapeptide repeat-containing protein [Marinicaulis sp.]NNE41771.1 pentapeptide repeat-containing protein [Marinicaulis sp.]NNL89407.1 pentapeptide repeat-containing protein [Marinicaulis sp.]
MKIVALIVLFMIMAFSLVTAIVPGSQSRGNNPVQGIQKEISRSLNSVDDGLGSAFDRVEANLPLPGKKNKAGEVRLLMDHTGVDFNDQDLPKSNFASSIISDAQFERALLDEAILEGAVGEETHFTRARMAGANLTAGAFAKSDFTGAELREAVARATDFEKAVFTDGDISFAALSGSNFDGAKMNGAYGIGAIFVDATLTNVDFRGGDFTGARFEMAKLRGAVFEGADLTKAVFDGANIYGTDFRGALNLTSEQLLTACANTETKLPEGVAAVRC